jgi:hypothetical protein
VTERRAARQSWSKSQLLHSAAGAADWTPPPLGEFHSSIGSSVIDQFVADHSPSDVIRELAQNEYDACGTKLLVRFGTNGLSISGNGRKIDKAGWSRLRLLMGTGRVIGDANDEEVAPKLNGIGSKNFGLRSLFLFGNRIFVASDGLTTVLDLKEIGSQQVIDKQSRGQRGVRIEVPRRTEAFNKLSAFTDERESLALDQIAANLPLTLVKLIHPSSGRGLREVSVFSERHRRRLLLRQSAERVRLDLKGVVGLRRMATLADNHIDDKGTKRQTSAEIEFRKSIPIPAEYAHIRFARFFRGSNGKLHVDISLPLRGKQIDLSLRGLFYYPIGVSTALTGTAVSVSAPFEMDGERTKLLDSEWNRWLISEAALLTSEMLTRDWLKRFGADAYSAVLTSVGASPSWFVEEIEAHLKRDACWPTRMRKAGAIVFRKAEEIVWPADPALDEFLEDEERLDRRLADTEKLRIKVSEIGARRFSVDSLIR